MKQKKAIVFISAGLGDAVLLIPLIKQLKRKGFLVTGFFNSLQPCEEIFTDINLLDELIILKSKFRQIAFTALNLLTYDKAFVNYFAANRSNLLVASFLAKEIITNKKENALLHLSKLKFVEPVKNIHDAQQNLNLLQDNAQVSLQDFYVQIPSKKNELLPASFIVVQISAGNNKITYKNWPVNYWIDFLQLVLKNYPEKKIVLLGDKNEAELAEQITDRFNDNIVSYIGKTNITEAMHIINSAQFFIGLDGGLMHIAVALKKPTFTIWGPSSMILYGYEQFSHMHKCVSLNLDCNPCSAWINANHSKALSPETCPDHACLQQLMPQMVFNKYTDYVNLFPAYAN